jgi:hypothetical protein
MLANVLRNTEWSQLGAFVSPAFFDVMPPLRLLRRARSMLTTRDAPRYRNALARHREAILAAELDLPSVRPEQAAEALLALYFQQLFADAPTLIDLRKAAFDTDGDLASFHPAPWVVEWDAPFIAGLRQVYSGFYDGDDACLTTGLEALGIGPCEDLFRAHFGGHTKRQVFRTRDFIATFHKVFVRCRDLELHLHPDFFPLGVYLAALYDHLDGSELELDVEAAFLRGTAPLVPTAERKSASLTRMASTRA